MTAISVAKLRAAYLRADRAIVGAVIVVLLGTALPFAFDSIPNLNPTLSAELADAPSGGATIGGALFDLAVVSPVELAAANIGRDQECLAEAMYHEARGEGPTGEKAVAEVIVQRAQSRYYPNTICGVVHQGVERGDLQCQFSYACNGLLEKAPEPVAWEQSRKLAARIMSGAVKLDGQTENAIAYHATSVTPDWADGMQRTRQIGNHVFYRRMPVVRVEVEQQEPQPRSPTSNAPLPNRRVLPYGTVSSMEVETDIETGSAVGNGT